MPRPRAHHRSQPAARRSCWERPRAGCRPPPTPRRSPPEPGPPGCAAAPGARPARPRRSAWPVAARTNSAEARRTRATPISAATLPVSTRCAPDVSTSSGTAAPAASAASKTSELAIWPTSTPSAAAAAAAVVTASGSTSSRSTRAGSAPPASKRGDDQLDVAVRRGHADHQTTADQLGCSAIRVPSSWLPSAARSTQYTLRSLNEGLPTTVLESSPERRLAGTSATTSRPALVRADDQRGVEVEPAGGRAQRAAAAPHPGSRPRCWTSTAPARRTSRPRAARRSSPTSWTRSPGPGRARGSGTGSWWRRRTPARRRPSP